MPTLASAQTVTFGVQGDQTITLSTSPGTEGTLSWNAPNGVQVQTIGPMPLVNQVIRMNGVSGAATLVSKSGAITYTVSPSLLPVSPIDATGAAMGGVYNLAQSAVPVMIAQSGWVYANGTMVPGVNTVSPTVTLSATSGAGVTLTSSVAAFAGTAADVGKQITIYDNVGLQFRSALITAAISTTQATVTLKSTFSGTTLNPGTAGFFVGNPLPTNYTGGIWVYLPSGAVSGGAAGFYWCTAANTATTDGMLQIQSAYQSSMGVPSIPTGFSNAVGSSAAFTGVTTQQTLASVTVPGGAMGANGSLRTSPAHSMSASATAKNGLVFLGGANIIFQSITGATLGTFSQSRIWNRGVQNAQVNNVNNGVSGFGAAQALFNTVDTSVSQSLTFTGQLTAATDFIVLEGFTVEVLPRA